MALIGVCFLEDWFVVKDLLVSIDLDPFACEVHIVPNDCTEVAASASKLYKISLPRQHVTTGRQDKQNAPPHSLHFDPTSSSSAYELLIKVNSRDAFGANEVSMLKEIHNTWQMHQQTSSKAVPTPTTDHNILPLS
jgi:hypothetical protein